MDRHIHGMLNCELSISKEQRLPSFVPHSFPPSFPGFLLSSPFSSCLPSPLPSPLLSLLPSLPFFVYLLNFPSVKVSLHFKIFYIDYSLFSILLHLDSFKIRIKVTHKEFQLLVLLFWLISLFMTSTLVIYFSTIYIM